LTCEAHPFEPWVTTTVSARKLGAVDRRGVQTPDRRREMPQRRRAAAGAASAGISLNARSVRPLGIPRSCVDEWRAACNGAIIEEGLRNAKIAHFIQIILTRQLAGYLSVPLFLVDPKGDLLFYNEPAEALLGRRFDETGAMPAEEWSTVFTPVVRCHPAAGRDRSKEPLLRGPSPGAIPLSNVQLAVVVTRRTSCSDHLTTPRGGHRDALLG
jgi:hypothetical protein